MADELVKLVALTRLLHRKEGDQNGFIVEPGSDFEAHSSVAETLLAAGEAAAHGSKDAAAAKKAAG